MRTRLSSCPLATEWCMVGDQVKSGGQGSKDCVYSAPMNCYQIAEVGELLETEVSIIGHTRRDARDATCRGGTNHEISVGPASRPLDRTRALKLATAVHEQLAASSSQLTADRRKPPRA